MAISWGSGHGAEDPWSRKSGIVGLASYDPDGLAGGYPRTRMTTSATK